jgi:hypothetical protein
MRNMRYWEGWIAEQTHTWVVSQRKRGRLLR